jgi:hypothetical protein
VPKDGRPTEHVKNHGRACTQVLFLSKAELGFFHFLEIVTSWLAPSAGQKILVLAGTFHPKRSRLLKTGFFMQVMELKIQRKNPGHALGFCTIWIYLLLGICRYLVVCKSSLILILACHKVHNWDLFYFINKIWADACARDFFSRIMKWKKKHNKHRRRFWI